MILSLELLQRLAARCGFELCGATPAQPLEEYASYRKWSSAGMAGRMSYLTDRRGSLRSDPRNLLPTARSVICVGKLYNRPESPSSLVSSRGAGRGWISRYAWGEDYHSLLRTGLENLADELRRHAGEFDFRIAVDTAPLLERSLARRAGLGWIGKNTCLIREGQGSWFFLGEMLTSLEIETGHPPPDRCGTCRRCIDACPTQALVRNPEPEGPEWILDSRLCISYLTIELRGEIPETLRPHMGNHVFGCDICQDVCPWNGDAPISGDPAFAPRNFAPELAGLAAMTEDEFRRRFRGSPVLRAKYRGFLRNVAVAMGNCGSEAFVEALERLRASTYEEVASCAHWALLRIRGLLNR